VRLGRTPRADRPQVDVGPGERLLAWAETADGAVLAGTRDAVYLPGGVRLPWEQVEAADWDRDAELFRLREMGSWGEQRREHAFAVGEPGRFLELVRERVTASLVLQRHVPVRDGAGLRVIARRAPRGGTIAWFVHYDEGVDPGDPEVRTLADAALVAARGEVGHE
jgi:hypothetical protein